MVVIVCLSVVLMTYPCDQACTQHDTCYVSADAIHSHETAAAPVAWPSVDVVTDRNGLRKHLRWLNPSPGRQVRDFRIDVQFVGTRTLVLGSWECSSREPPTKCTYGIGFENALTRPAPALSFFVP